jgi:hypothetical protein
MSLRPTVGKYTSSDALGKKVDVCFQGCDMNVLLHSTVNKRRTSPS